MGNGWHRAATAAALGIGMVLVLSVGKLTVAAPAATSAKASPAAKKKLPRLLDLGGASCMVCKQMAPILEEVMREQAGKIEVQFIDVWKDPAAGRKHGIKLIPTQVFYDLNGKEFFRHEGFYPKSEILAVFAKRGIPLAKPPAGAEQAKPSGAGTH
jgi:thioredoxin 1